MRLAIAALAVPTLAVVALTGCSQSEDDARTEAFCAEVPDLLQGIRMNVSIANTVGGDQAIDSPPEEAEALATELEPYEQRLTDTGAAVDEWGQANC